MMLGLGLHDVCFHVGSSINALTVLIARNKSSERVLVVQMLTM